MLTSECSKCKRMLPQEAFGIRRDSPTGRQSICKACRAEWARQWRVKNPEAQAKILKRYKDTDGQRWATLWRKYGLTRDDFETMHAAQDGLCAICRRDERSTARTGIKTQLHVDHCHATEVVRGILCKGCNLLLGYAEDRIDILEAAIEYLRRFQEQQELAVSA